MYVLIVDAIEGVFELSSREEVRGWMDRVFEMLNLLKERRAQSAPSASTLEVDTR